MEAPLNVNMSLDDICLNRKPVASPERRARSSSPVKNRRSLPPNFFDMKLPNLPYAREDDIKSISSGSSSLLSPDQLKLLSKSPVFSRLHVNTSPDRSQYVIPIPFTLKLPPKLSPLNQNFPPTEPSTPKSSRLNHHKRESSPTRSLSPKKPGRLVYNGNGYEKYESLSESEDGEEERSKREYYSRNSAPPPVATNKRKSKKQSIQAKLISHDELSTIDEASNYANSRNATLKAKKVEKSLPTPPGIEEASIKEKHSPETFHLQPISPLSIERKGDFKFKVTPRPNMNSERETSNNKPVSPQYQYSNNTIDDVRKMLDASRNRNVTDNYFTLNQMTNAPIDSRLDELKIHKRSFSDESKVSSLSSFSSFGGILNTSPSPNLLINNQPAPKLNDAPIQIEKGHEQLVNTRVSSNGSTTSYVSAASSNGSWNSLQKSIDINDSNNSNDSSHIKLVGRAVVPLEENETEIIKIGDKAQNVKAKSVSPVYAKEHQDYEAVKSSGSMKSSSNLNTNTDFEKVSNIPLDPKLNASNESDNDGAGTNFNFPAGNNNITNSKELKQKASRSGSRRSSAYISEYRSPSGQIEIPDLDDKSTTQKYSMANSLCSFNGTTFDDLDKNDDSEEGENSKLEPIGFPSKAAKNVVKEHFKSMHQDEDSDTDIESAKYSYCFNNMPKSKLDTCITNRALPPLPISENLSNPIRHPLSKSARKHVRHKSMFNIDFNEASLSSPNLQTQIKPHKRSRSVDLNKMVSRDSSKIEKASSDILQPKAKSIQNEATPQEMKISVMEPPRPINYEVDFKEASDKDNFPNYPTTRPGIYAGNTISNEENKISDDLKGLNLNQVISNMNQNGKYAFGGNPTPYNVPVTTRHSAATASSSGSSYQSSRSTKNTNYTSMSDSDSVIIDLTKDKYDICMIQRNSSTQSYRSVTERTREGKQVEVVLVEDEDEDKDDNDEDMDELASIYSKYRNNWVFRTDSTTSNVSNTSTNSYDSGVASESQLKLKPTSNLMLRYQQLQKSRSMKMLTSQAQNIRFSSSTLPLNTSTTHDYKEHPIENDNNVTSQLPKEPPRLQVNSFIPESATTPNLNSNYFDYASDNYDFKSFMKQQINT